MLAAAKNLGDGAGGMDDLLVRLRAREKARHGLQVHKHNCRRCRHFLTVALKSERKRLVPMVSSSYSTNSMFWARSI